MPSSANIAPRKMPLTASCASSEELKASTLVPPPAVAVVRDARHRAARRKPVRHAPEPVVADVKHHRFAHPQVGDRRRRAPRAEARAAEVGAAEEADKTGPGGVGVELR